METPILDAAWAIIRPSWPPPSTPRRFGSIAAIYVWPLVGAAWLSLSVELDRAEAEDVARLLRVAIWVSVLEEGKCLRRSLPDEHCEVLATARRSHLELVNDDETR
eukprot:3140995-Pleurochrysis_carterae.AAC.16